MKKHIFITGMLLIICAPPSYAVTRPDCVSGTCTDANWNSTVGKFYSCSHGETCTCMQPDHTSVTYECGCDNDSGCSYNQYCLDGACLACKTCSNCTTDAWAAAAPGHQVRNAKSCGCRTGVCTTMTEYRCAAGYYGTSANGSNGCTRCPPVDSTVTPLVYGTSNAGQGTTITACYLTPGTYKDRTGTFTISGGNCGYGE